MASSSATVPGALLSDRMLEYFAEVISKRQSGEELTSSSLLLPRQIEQKEEGCWVSFDKATTTSEGLKAGSVSESFSNLAWAKSLMQGTRSSMEDADVFQVGFDAAETHLFAVFDGHGGQEVASLCADVFPTLLRHVMSNKKRFRHDDEDEFYRKALTESLLLFDHLLLLEGGSPALAELAKDPSKGLPKLDDSKKITDDTSGSTAIVCLMVGKNLHVANVGDSRCVLCRSKTNFNLSDDHSPDNPEEKKRIEAAGGRVFDGRVQGDLAMSRALGDSEFKRDWDRSPSEQLVIADPDVLTETIVDDTDEFLVLACDGLFMEFTWETLVAFIRRGLAEGLPLDVVVEMTLNVACPRKWYIGDNETLQVILLPTTACRKLVEEGVEASKLPKE